MIVYLSVETAEDPDFVHIKSLDAVTGRIKTEAFVLRKHDTALTDMIESQYRAQGYQVVVSNPGVKHADRKAD